MEQSAFMALFKQYSNAVGKGGPHDPAALELRRVHHANRNFLRYADAVDRIKKAVGGSGMGEKSSQSS